MDPKIAFFSMEIGIDESIPTYSGGLGILAGDILRSADNLKLPIVGITLLYKKGYFHQNIENCLQVEQEETWNPEEKLKKLDNKVTITIGDETLTVACLSYRNILFLDTDLDENPPHFRIITQKLYQEDRIKQEMVLGIAGVKMLDELGYDIEKYHMNEGHSAFLTLELLKQRKDVKKMCVFTTHTPISAGHDRFPKSKIKEYFREYTLHDEMFDGEELNMTHLGLRNSGYINGVANRHRTITEKMFPGFDIESITNGIHATFWTCEPMAKLFDRYLPNWRDDPFSLRGAMNIPRPEIWEAHMEAKRALIAEINSKTDKGFDEDIFTIGFARRFVSYKRSDLILSDIGRLKKIIKDKGQVQIIFSGKAHPYDQQGKDIIKRINEKIKSTDVKIVFLENYNITIAKLLISGCDIWLNNPKRPLEASGTSGMKAAVNGVPQFSTLDGWWLEGHIEGVTGWSIGIHPSDPHFDEDETPDDEAQDLYKKLGEVILPLFYGDREQWMRMMRACIAINGSFFNTHRVVQQYVMEAYF